MSVDKNLFPYDLAVVSIMKNAAPYVKEWLDYHLLAGVNHFFIYDNESEDNFKEVLQPYIDAGLVTYIFRPGKAQLIPVYNAAVRDFKFFCRYMSVIDDDEFIFPKENLSITEVVDKILADNPKATGLGANWILYGSNNLEKADYSVGVLERFTSREEKVNPHVKTIANPRCIDYFSNPHFAVYFKNCCSVNEDGQIFSGPFNEVESNNKIAINHYHTKSFEEYALKKSRGDGLSFTGDKYSDEFFKTHDRNEVFDDGILKYRDERRKIFLPNGEDIIETFAELNQINFDRILKAVTSNLLPAFEEDDTKKFLDNPTNRFEYFNVLVKFLDEAPQDFFQGRLENFFTCLVMSSYLRANFVDDELGGLLEEFSLYAINKAALAGTSTAELQFLIKELPRILMLPYPVAQEIRSYCFQVIPKFMDILRVTEKDAWKEFVSLDYLIRLLKVFDDYKHR